MYIFIHSHKNASVIVSYLAVYFLQSKLPLIRKFFNLIASGDFVAAYFIVLSELNF